MNKNLELNLETVIETMRRLAEAVDVARRSALHAGSPAGIAMALDEASLGLHRALVALSHSGEAPLAVRRTAAPQLVMRRGSATADVDRGGIQSSVLGAEPVAIGRAATVTIDKECGAAPTSCSVSCEGASRSQRARGATYAGEGCHMKITVTANGPYSVTGGVPLARQTIATDSAGNSIGWEQGEPIDTAEEYALCRCGHSANKPFCDQTHLRILFDGTETASKTPHRDQAAEQNGPIVGLTDVQRLCAFARFCDVAGQVWNLVEVPDQRAAAMAVQEAELCPSGRLVAWNLRTGAAFEPAFEPSIGVVEDPAQGVSGPLWIRGGIPVVATDGSTYEVRNRVTLCRCGASQNKPFCDGTHAAIGFRDGIRS